jgi:FKBP-type peptidyl-prolyl cis-trans isomerase
MSTTKTQRIVSLALALMFLVSTIGVGVFYLLVNTDQSQQTTNQTNTGGTTLEGTKLSNFTPIASVPTLQTIDTTPGTGAEVKSGDTVTVHYTGALAKDGTIFQSSLDTGQPISFSLSGVIQGWQQGIPGMKEGGTRRLIIPASLAYGSQANGTIPANSDLVFDVQLVKIGQ